MSEEPHLDTVKCWLTIGFAALSLVVSAFVLSLYVYQREALRSPVMDTFMASFVMSLFASVNFIVSASMHLNGKLGLMCNLSMYFFQQFAMPAIAMQGAFFVGLSYTLAGGKYGYIGVRRVLVGFVLLGALACVIPMASLPYRPSTDSPFGATEPWCWLPEADLPDGKSSTKLVVYKLVFGYFWVGTAMLFGGISMLWVSVRSWKLSKTIPTAMKWGLVYYTIFTAGWLVASLPRFVPELSPSTLRGLERFLAIMSPGYTALTGLLYCYMEDAIGLLRNDRCRFVDFSAPLQPRESGSNLENHTPSPRAPGINAAISEHYKQLRDVVARRNEVDSSTLELGNLSMAAYDPDLQEWLVLTERADGAAAQRSTQINIDGSGQQLVLELPDFPKPPIGVGLSLIGGYCDACGFVTMNLFTAHITGNLVLVGVHIANDQVVDLPDLLPQLIAIPVFCTVIFIFHYLGSTIALRFHKRFLLGFEAFFFLLSFIVARSTGPFLPDRTHSAGAYGAGFLMIAGMALQNSYQRGHLVGLPMTTFMTGNANQIMHDCVDIFKKRKLPASERSALVSRTKKNVMCVSVFFTGAALASVFARYYGMWCYLPPFLMVVGIIVIFWDETAMEKKS